MARGRSRSRVTQLLVALIVALGAAFVASAPTGDAATVHRAGVIVDTGSTVHEVVITFSQDSVTGLEALQLAGANPGVFAFGQGTAVCNLYGVGNPATLTACLVGPNSQYWAYFRAAAGTSAFSYSGTGAGATTVHDGDVEGWRYEADRIPPPFATVAQIAPPPAAPTSATAGTAPRPATTPAPPRVPPGGAVGGSATTPTTTVAPGAPAPLAPAAAGAAAGSSTTPTTSTSRRKARSEVAAERAAASRPAGGGGTNPTLSIAGFVVVLAGLGAGILFARRARVGRSAGGS